MAKNQLSKWKINILSPLSFHQLLKLVKRKWAQNFDFPLKKFISGHLYFFFFQSRFSASFVQIFQAVGKVFGGHIGVFRKAVAMLISDLPLLVPANTSFCFKSPIEYWSDFKKNWQNVKVDDRKVRIANMLG